MRHMLEYLASEKIPIGGGQDAIDIPTVAASDSTVFTFMNTVYLWAGIIAVIIMVIAGYIFVTSSGNTNQVERAKNAILGTVIGLVVILFAFIITQFVIRAVVEGA